MSKPLKVKYLQIFEIVICLILCVILLFTVIINTNKIKKYQPIVLHASNKYQIDASLIFAIIKVESNFNDQAVSNKGAYGLMQITASTFNYVCEKFNLNYTINDILNPEVNIFVGTCYLKYLFDKFNDESLVITAYNGGEGNLTKWLNDEKYSTDGKSLIDIPFTETKNYVKKVSFYKSYFNGRLNEISSTAGY